MLEAEAPLKHREIFQKRLNPVRRRNREASHELPAPAAKLPFAFTEGLKPGVHHEPFGRIWIRPS